MGVQSTGLSLEAINKIFAEESRFIDILSGDFPEDVFHQIQYLVVSEHLFKTMQIKLPSDLLDEHHQRRCIVSNHGNDRLTVTIILWENKPLGKGNARVAASK